MISSNIEIKNFSYSKNLKKSTAPKSPSFGALHDVKAVKGSLLPLFVAKTVFSSWEQFKIALSKSLVTDFYSLMRNPSKIQRPEIKRPVIFPKGYKDNFTPLQCDLIDCAADEFSRAEKSYYLEDLLKNKNPFTLMVQFFTNILDAKYDNLRHAKYSPAGADNRLISKFSGTSTATTDVIPQNGWHYRIPDKFRVSRQFPSTSKIAIDRLSLNAHASPELIDKLDKYFDSGLICGYYKTPITFEGWLGRHDPITIYLHQKITPEIEKNIAEMAKPYIRSTQNVLPGRLVIPGIAVQTSPTPELIDKLIDDAKQIDINLAKGIIKQWGGSARHLEIASTQVSAGQIEAAQDLVNVMKYIYEKNNAIQV